MVSFIASSTGYMGSLQVQHFVLFTERTPSIYTLCTNWPGKNVWTRAYLILERNRTSIHFVPFDVNNSKKNWAKFGVGVKLIVILRHIIAYFSINIRWHSQYVSSDSRKWLIKHLFPPSSRKKQINKHNSYLLLAFLQSGSVPELDMHESKQFSRVNLYTVI